MKISECKSEVQIHWKCGCPTLFYFLTVLPIQRCIASLVASRYFGVIMYPSTSNLVGGISRFYIIGRWPYVIYQRHIHAYLCTCVILKCKIVYMKYRCINIVAKSRIMTSRSIRWESRLWNRLSRNHYIFSSYLIFKH